MIYLSLTFSILCAGYLAYQDWKTRSISILVLCFFTVVTAWYVWEFNGAIDWLDSLINLGILTYHVTALWLYVSIKNRKATPIHKRHFGLGDILFLAACCTAFENQTYVWMILLTALSAILGTLFIYRFRPEKRTTIPFVSYGALVYAILTVWTSYMSLNGAPLF